MLLAVNYHYLRPSFDAPYESICGVTPAQFEEQLITLGRAGEFVSAAQLRATVRGLRRLPERAILITFDDGLREQYEYALPVLQRLRIPALFFINTAPIAYGKVATVHKIHLLRSQVEPARFLNLVRRKACQLGIELSPEVDIDAAIVRYGYDAPDVARLKYLLNFLLEPALRERLLDECFEEVFPAQEEEISRRLYMDYEQVQELGRLQYAGNHTHEHLPLGLLRCEAAEQDVRLSQSLLEEWIGYRPYAMSYPYGSIEACSLEVGRMAASHGVEFALTMERAGNPSLKRPLHLARVDCNDVPGGKAPLWNLPQLFADIPRANWYQ